jgi:adenine-specific DNA-methyltransferase
MTFSGSATENLLRKIDAVKNFALDERKEIAHGIDVLQDVVSSKASAKLRGVAQVGDGIFVLNDVERNDLKLSKNENQLLRPYFTTKELARYFGNSRNVLWIIYTNSTYKKKGAMSPFPKIKSHLDKFSPILTSVNKPYGLHRARDENFFKGEKIFAQRKSSSPTFTYTAFDCYVSRMFISIKSDRINLKYLTALLNSNVVKFWLKNNGKMQGQNFQLDNEPLLAIPLVSPSKEEEDRIAKLVDLILQASEKLRVAVLDSERDRYQRLIDQTDARIQEAVYTYYMLTDSDIDLISTQNT